MNVVELAYKRWFSVLTLEECLKLNLEHVRNIYGDEINASNCRSIWVDKNGKKYRCESLHYQNYTKS